MDSRISTGLQASASNSDQLVDKTEAGPERALNSELKRLLGPLVPALFRDASGALDLSRIPAKSFDEFKQFLSAQAALNDGKSFRNPYQKMLEGEQFRSLLGLLYQEKDPQHFVSISAEEGRSQLDELTAALIEIDADTFVQGQLSSREGLGRLRHVLGKVETFTGDQRTDVAKALGRARDHSEDQLYSYCIDQEISLWNFFNLGVQEEEVARASALAVKLIEGLEERLPVSNSKFEALNGVEASLTEKFQKIQKDKSGDPHPVSQAQAALADLWLLTANQKSWSIQNQYGGYEDRAHALKQIERLFESSEGIQDEDGFRAFNEELQDFIEGAITTQGDDATAWAEHRILGIGMEQVYDNVDPAQRGPYQRLQRLSSEWQHAAECGLTILGHLQANASEDAALRDGANRLILSLKETQRQLWHGYKQHKAISRLGSDLAQIPYLVAKGVGAEQPADYALGDNAQIDAANQEIGRIIEYLGKAKSQQELGQEIEKLHELMKPGSLLYAAYEAAEMDGTEQVLGLAQTVAIITATAMATRGGSVVAGSGVVAARSIAMASWLDKAVKGFAWGAYIATAENVVAAGTGEVREGEESADKWLKDAISTGASTAMTGPWAEAAAGTTAEQGVVRNLFYRYTANGFNGAKHLAGDIAMETGEEVADQVFRQGLDGKTLAPRRAELEEIAKITAAGGGTKIGALAEAMKHGSQPSPSEATRPEGAKTESPVALQSPLLAPMWTMLGAGGIGGSDGKGGLEDGPRTNIAAAIAKALGSKDQSSPQRLQAVQELLGGVGAAPTETLVDIFETIKNSGRGLELEDRRTLLDDLHESFMEHDIGEIEDLTLEAFADLAGDLPPLALKEYYDVLESIVTNYQCTKAAANRGLLALFQRLGPADRLESAKRLQRLSGTWLFKFLIEEDWLPFQAALKLHLSPEQLEELDRDHLTPFYPDLEESDEPEQEGFPELSGLEDSEGLSDEERWKRVTQLEVYFEHPDSSERADALRIMVDLILKLPAPERLAKSKVLAGEVAYQGFEDLPSIMALNEVFPHLDPEQRLEQFLNLREAHAAFPREDLGDTLFDLLSGHLSPEHQITVALKIAHSLSIEGRLELVASQLRRCVMGETLMTFVLPVASEIGPKALRDYAALKKLPDLLKIAQFLESSLPPDWRHFEIFWNAAEPKDNIDKSKLNAVGLPLLAAMAIHASPQDAATVLGAGIAALLVGMAMGPYRDARPTLSPFELVMFDSQISLDKRLEAIEGFRKELLGGSDLRVYEGITTLLDLAANAPLPLLNVNFTDTRKSERRQIRLAAMKAIMELSQGTGEKVYQMEPHEPGRADAIVAEWKTALYQFLSSARADLEYDFETRLEKRTVITDLNKPLREAFMGVLKNLGLNGADEFEEVDGTKYWEASSTRWAEPLVGGAVAAWFGVLAYGQITHSRPTFWGAMAAAVLFLGSWVAHSIAKDKGAQGAKAEANSASERLAPSEPSETSRVRIAEPTADEAPSPTETKPPVETQAEIDTSQEAEEEEAASSGRRNLNRFHSMLLLGAGSGMATLLTSGGAEAATAFPAAVTDSTTSVMLLTGSWASVAASFGILGSIFLRLSYALGYQGRGVRLDAALRERNRAIQDDPRILAIHNELHAPEARIRILAAEQAGQKEFRELAADLVSLLHDPEPEVRKAAHDALHRMATEDEIAGVQKQREVEIEELRGWFHDPGTRLRELAASLAWMYRDRSLIPELLAMADDPDPKISNGVLGSLALLTNASDLASLILVLKSHPSPELEEGLRSLIPFIVRRSPVGELEEHFRHFDPFVRGNMINAAMLRSDHDALPLIVRSLKDPDPQVRIAAIQALQLTANAEVLPEIKKRLADPSPPVRFAAKIAVEVLSQGEDSPPASTPKPRDPRTMN